jgi:hypothetical protein
MSDHQVVCLYCESPSRGAGKAHVVPESIHRGGPTLPSGAICDKCNHYFGQKLEPQVLRHPFVAIPLQLLRLPGKRGHQRKAIGLVELAGEVLDLPASIIGQRVDPDGTRVTTIKFGPWLDANFQLTAFRRGIHLFALNYWALHHGVTSARTPQLGPVRRYIRSAGSNERWAFIQDSKPPDPIDAEVGARFITGSGSLIVGVRVFNTDYYVDLYNSGGLTALSPEWRGTNPRLIGADLLNYPTPPGIRPGEYRLEIY